MIVGLGVAAKIVNENFDQISRNLRDIRDYFEEKLDVTNSLILESFGKI